LLSHLIPAGSFFHLFSTGFRLQITSELTLTDQALRCPQTMTPDQKLEEKLPKKIVMIFMIFLYEFLPNFSRFFMILHLCEKLLSIDLIPGSGFSHSNYCSK
jgi:hypothetical protein